MDTNEGAGQTYSAQDQISTKTTTENEEQYYHILEAGECEGVPEEVCDHKVPVFTTDPQSSVAV